MACAGLGEQQERSGGVTGVDLEPGREHEREREQPARACRAEHTSRGSEGLTGRRERGPLVMHEAEMQQLGAFEAPMTGLAMDRERRLVE